MIGFIRGLMLGLLLIGAGWVVGSIYPAPATVTEPIARNMPSLASRLGLDDVSLESLRGMLSDEELIRLRHDASQLAARAGEAIVVERDPERLAAQIAALPEEMTPVAAPAPTSAGAPRFEATLSTCPGMRVSNAPRTDAQRQVLAYTSVVDVQGVAIATNPTRNACLSSAFGPRGSGQHNGVDYYSANGGPILAAADGVVIEAKYRDDYGNMLLIDHGNGVYTRYAHLSSFAEGVVAGERVIAGQQIGLMGNTASYAIPIHLHYEVLTGDYNNPRASFGLTPRSPFS
jgi:murein DD-endopeptidase MepM/ murein hydrolase activator NlpD